MEDAYVAYCLDEAIAVFVNRVNSELETVKSKNPKAQAMMREQKLQQILSGKKAAPQAFATPKPTKVIRR